LLDISEKTALFKDAAAVNYLGAMTKDYREKLVKNWLIFCKTTVSLPLPNYLYHSM
jgi:hypothetical protein